MTLFSNINGMMKCSFLRAIFSGSGNPELKNRVKKPSYGLWSHKTELGQIVTSKLIFRNSETLQ